jgi:hypothetical protein
VQYVVCSSHMRPSKIKGELPDVLYQYIGNDSMIPWHYTLTKNKEEAYLFDDFELNDAKEIASFWNMKLKDIERMNH